MKRTVVLAALLALFLTNAFAQRTPTFTDDDIEAPKPKVGEKGKPIASGIPATKTDLAWAEFSSEEGGFAAKWPGKPAEKSQKIDTDSGPLDQKMFALDKDGVSYGVIYFDLPAAVQSAEEMEQRFAGVRNRFLKNDKVKLLSETATTLAGYAGKEFQYEQGDRIVTMKIFAIRQRVYSVFVAPKKGENPSDTESPFFSSFKIMGQ